MPKIIDVEQGSIEWLQAKLGIPSASEIDKVVTPTGKLSKQSLAYAYRLVAERLLGRTLVSLDHIDAIASGKQLEPEAIALYEFERGMDAIKVGFVTTNDGRVGCSPDRFVGGNGLLEVKSPLPQTHVAYLLAGFNGDYHCQRQCQLFVTERDWLDMMSYSRELPPVIVRYERDEPYITLLRDALDQFCDLTDEMTRKAHALGATPKPKRPKSSLPHGPNLSETIRLNEAALRLLAP
jgi:hypothetical protein